ncbi:MAG TPA: hypothetical protein VIW24_29600 [Aldersonia sp.]
MTEPSIQATRSAGQPDQPSAWAAGFVMFAAVLMIMAGIFQAISGLVALFQDEFYLTTANYLLQFDTTTWGWIHLLLGLLVMFAGVALLAGQTWARVIGVILAALSAVSNFTFIPYYPFWSLAIITLDIVIIWALTTHGRDITG